MKSYRVNNSARMNFGFFLTPTPDNDPKCFPEEHQLLEVASKEASDKLKEFKIRPRTFLSMLGDFDRNIISSVKAKVEEFVNSASEEVKQASPLISQFLTEEGNSAMFAYSSAVCFVCMKKYADTIEFKKRMDAQGGQGGQGERRAAEPQRPPKRRNENRQAVLKRNRNDGARTNGAGY